MYGIKKKSDRLILTSYATISHLKLQVVNDLTNYVTCYDNISLTRVKSDHV